MTLRGIVFVQVLRSDSYKNWDWSAIGALFQRLLDEDAVAFEEVYRTSFFSRLETFFAPGSGASEGPHAAGSTNDGGRTPSRGSFRVQKITDLNDLDTGINLGFGGIGFVALACVLNGSCPVYRASRSASPLPMPVFGNITLLFTFRGALLVVCGSWLSAGCPCLAGGIATSFNMRKACGNSSRSCCCIHREV